MMNAVQTKNGKASASMTSAIPIITYHSIDPSGSVVSTDRGTFRRQMQFLRENGYSTLTLRGLARLMGAQTEVDAKSVVLTFDDGFKNFYTDAFPILNEFGFSATVFLVTDFCGKFNDWAGNPPELPRSELLSWREIKELSAKGIEFGSHTRSHPNLTLLCLERVEAEIADSKAVIEDNLGQAAETFAYPYGKSNAQVRRIAGKHFAASCTTDLGKVDARSDTRALRRLDAYYLSNTRVFERLSSTSFDAYMRFRQSMRRVKSSIRAASVRKEGPAL